jgi:hypothetical protein
MTIQTFSHSTISRIPFRVISTQSGFDSAWQSDNTIDADEDDEQAPSKFCFRVFISRLF